MKTKPLKQKAGIKTREPLAQEARKYKNAEEFVNVATGTGKDSFYTLINPKIDEAVKQGRKFPTQDSIKEAFPKEWDLMKKSRGKSK